MPPSIVSDDEWLCRFLVLEDGDWDEDNEEPTPRAFKASNRELSFYHPEKVAGLGSSLRDLCIDRLEGAGEAHLQVKACIELGQCISTQFDPKVYWRPEKVREPWERWKEAHAQVESTGGHSDFPLTYRIRLVANSTNLRPPDGI